LPAITRGAWVWALLILVLSACGISDGTPAYRAGEDIDKEGEASRTELKIISWRVEDKLIYDEINELFEREHPNIKVTFDAVLTKDYYLLMNARIASNDVDIAAVNLEKDVKPPTRGSMWLDLGDSKAIQAFNKDYLDLVRPGDTYKMLPWNRLTNVVYYNKRIFREMGLDIPQTWEQFVVVAEKIKKAGITPIMLGAKDQWPINMIVIELEQSIVRGARPDFYEQLASGQAKFTDPDWIEVFQKVEQIGEYTEANPVAVPYLQTPVLFAQGEAAMMIDGSWSLGQVQDAKPEFEVGIFILPGSDNAAWNRNIAVKVSDGWAINKNSAYTKEAFQYLEFFSRKDIYQKYIDYTKTFPVIDGVAVKDPLAKEILQLLEDNRPITNWEQLLSAGVKLQPEEYFIPVLTGSLSVEEAAAAMQEQFLKMITNGK